MARYYLGVDGGQSGTTALIGDSDRKVLGRGESGPCNHVSDEERRQKFVRVLRECISGAASQAGVEPCGILFDAACLGFSGGPADKEPLIRSVVRAGALRVTHDAEIALAGATGGKPGVIAIAGTGSIAFGRNAEGKTARAGGWGSLFGDEGGAFDIVRQAVRAVLKHEEGWGPFTVLRDRLLAATGAASANEMMHRFYTPEYPRDRIAAFAGLVDEAARDGDLAAAGILAKAAQELATLAVTVRHQLFDPGQKAILSYAGGVFASKMVRNRYRLLVEVNEDNEFAPPERGPAEGALLEAYRLAGPPSPSEEN